MKNFWDNFKEGIVHISNWEVSIIADDWEKKLKSTELSFTQWEKVKFDIGDTWDISCVQKASWEIQDILNMYQKNVFGDFQKGREYTRTLFAIDSFIIDWIHTTILTFKGKIPGEMQIAYGFQIWSSREWIHPLDGGGYVNYSFGDYTEEEMKKVCSKLVEYYKKQQKIDPDMSKLDFIWDEVRNERQKSL